MSSNEWTNRIIGAGEEAPDQLLANPLNFRIHPKPQQAALKGALDTLGWIQQVIVNKQTGHVVDGHLRIQLALRHGAPTVPVLYVDLSPEEEAQALLSLDPIAAMAATDKANMAALMDQVSTDNQAVMEYIAELAEREGVKFGAPPPDDVEPEIDKAEELRQKWGVETGQIWQLGEHKIICGDCTDIDRNYYYNCKTLIFDPPWDKNATAPIAIFENILAFTDGRRFGDVINIFGVNPAWVFVWHTVTNWYTPNRPLAGYKSCVWYGDLSNYDFDGSHYFGGAKQEEKRVSNTRGEYKYTPDPRGKHLADLFTSAITQEHNGASHSKPVDWFRMLIANCTSGDVYDPYLGTGASMVACNQIGRHCVGVEIDPAMCAVAIERVFQTCQVKPARIV